MTQKRKQIKCYLQSNAFGQKSRQNYIIGQCNLCCFRTAKSKKKKKKVYKIN